MSAHFVYRKYKSPFTADFICNKLSYALVEKGFIQTGNLDNTLYFKYPSIWFSSKRPLTCISRLSLEVIRQNGDSIVKIGVTFTKIRYFTIFIMAFFCFILPAVLGIVEHGVPDIPPMAFLGIPLGFMLHFHVRGRVFRALGLLIESIE